MIIIFLQGQDANEIYSLNIPVNVPGSNGEVEKKDEPVHGDQHQHRRQTLSNYLWNHPLQQQTQLGPFSGQKHISVYVNEV